MISADVGHRGTQLKLSLLLDGGQRVAFKPRWYSRDYVVTGEPYAGGDRHNGEIAAFTLNRYILNKLHADCQRVLGNVTFMSNELVRRDSCCTFINVWELGGSNKNSKTNY